MRIVEFYCPGCGTQIETEYLPPGHPITYDIEIDIDSLKERLRKGEFVIHETTPRGRRMNSIDIDVGGTFTDLVLNFKGKAVIKKVPTTPYDLSVCFSNVIEEGAGALGLQIEELAARRST